MSMHPTSATLPSATTNSPRNSPQNLSLRRHDCGLSTSSPPLGRQERERQREEEERAEREREEAEEREQRQHRQPQPADDEPEVMYPPSPDVDDSLYGDPSYGGYDGMGYAASGATAARVRNLTPGRHFSRRQRTRQR